MVKNDETLHEMAENIAQTFKEHNPTVSQFAESFLNSCGNQSQDEQEKVDMGV